MVNPFTACVTSCYVHGKAFPVPESRYRTLQSNADCSGMFRECKVSLENECFRLAEPDCKSFSSSSSSSFVTDGIVLAAHICLAV